MKRRAIICGGSIGGLFSALFLRQAGWDVVLLERADVELAGRGAGIVTHDVLNRLIVKAGAPIQDLGVQVSERVVFDRSGGVVTRTDFPQVVTSWDRVHSLLRAQIPPNSYRLGQSVTGYEDGPDGVCVTLANGEMIEGDLLVGADGFRSAVRAQMQPAIAPLYSGYVVWRALTAEAELSPEVRETVFPYFSLYAPSGTQVVGYPIAGPSNDLRQGRRRYNFVWYVPVSRAELDLKLTDATGHRHAVSIPPPMVTDAVLAEGVALAKGLLPPPFVEILDRSERPFFTPIYDHIAPYFAAGRVALTGDAACVARPHVGMGVTKAACDAEALARHLSGHQPIAQALAAYNTERQPQGLLAVETARRLGTLMFNAPGDVGNQDGRSNPNLRAILHETAVVPGSASCFFNAATDQNLSIA